MENFFEFETPTKEQLINEAQEEIKQISSNIDYYKAALEKEFLRINLAQFALTELEKK